MPRICILRGPDTDLQQANGWFTSGPVCVEGSRARRYQAGIPAGGTAPAGLLQAAGRNSCLVSSSGPETALLAVLRETISRTAQHRPGAMHRLNHPSETVYNRADV